MSLIVVLFLLEELTLKPLRWASPKSKHHGNLYHHGRIVEDAVVPARGLQVSILYKTFLVTTHIYVSVCPREDFSGKPCVFKKD
jgi:hypothetical protein